MHTATHTHTAYTFDGGGGADYRFASLLVWRDVYTQYNRRYIKVISGNRLGRTRARERTHTPKIHFIAPNTVFGAVEWGEVGGFSGSGALGHDIVAI